MKAILIDVKNQEVKEVEHDNTIENIYNHVDCRTFTVVKIDKFNVIFVDDEGLLKENLYFSYSALHHLRHFELAGNGLILGVDDEGNSVPTTLTVDEVKDKVSWLPANYSIEPEFTITEWEFKWERLEDLER